jgi:deoxyribodipyrimidine photo-lyase
VIHGAGRATTVVWFRRDLRLHDHPALRRAADAGDALALLFVVDDRLLNGRWRSPNRLWFLAGSVKVLADAVAARGGRLSVLRGNPRELVPSFARAVRAQRVVVSREYTPYGSRRDDAVRAALQAEGIDFEAHPGLLVHEPEVVRRVDGGGFSVFGPFRRAWSLLDRRPVLAPPKHIIAAELPSAWQGVAFPEPGSLLGDPAVSAEPRWLPEPGETAARRRLETWSTSDRLDAYDIDRDRLDRDGTSRLSQDLRFGLLSPDAVLERCAGSGGGRARFASEIAWREFYAHLLFREPRVARESFRPQLDAVAWTHDEATMAAWTSGRTGFPVVDAAMRQLVSTGWMHNRARMIAASFLTKDLLVDWRIGEAFFMEHLLDGDPASNNGGWQWAASTGTDPQPYFRVFNPALQGRRHDPDGDYVRRWVPELADVPAAEIHDPPPETRLARGYPAPIVDHREARLRAIAAFQSASAGGRGAERRS